MLLGFIYTNSFLKLCLDNNGYSGRLRLQDIKLSGMEGHLDSHGKLTAYLAMCRRPKERPTIPDGSEEACQCLMPDRMVLPEE